MTARPPEPPVRVLQVIDGLGTGGAERSLTELALALEAYGITTTVAVGRRSPVGVEAAGRAAGLDVEVLPPGRVARVRAAVHLARARRIDVLHSTLFGATTLARAVAPAVGLPLITSLVNIDDDEARRDDPKVRAWRLRGVRMIERGTAPATCHFHAITHAVADAARQQLGIDAGRLTVVPRGRDLGRLGEPGPGRRRATRERLGIAPRAPVVLAVGRQEFQKGHEHLLRAAATIREQHPELVVLIAGRPGGATATLEARHRELGLADAVRFLGHVDDVGDLLVAADVFAFPSRYEGQGGALLEAFALGVPAVVSDVPALREVSAGGTAARLVPPAAAAELARAILELLADPVEAAALGARGRARFDAAYTLESSVAGMAELYRDVLHRHRSGWRHRGIGRGGAPDAG